MNRIHQLIHHPIRQRILGLSASTAVTRLNIPPASYSMSSTRRMASSTANKSINSQKFDKAVSMIQSTQNSVDIDDQTKLVIYGLYKRISSGLSTSQTRPSIFDMVARAKYDAWQSHDHLSVDDAKAQYIQLVEKILNTQISTNNSTTATETASNIGKESSKDIRSSLKDILFPRKVGKDSFKNLQVATILCHTDENGIASITLNRPKKGNAFNLQMWLDYAEAFEAIDRDDSCKVVVVSGSPNSDGKSPSFSTGMDLDVFASLPQISSLEPCEGRKREGISRLIRFLQNAISGAENCPVPVIAKISGHCIGGAVDLITACDLRYCTKNSTFSIKETDLAMVIVCIYLCFLVTTRRCILFHESSPT